MPDDPSASSISPSATSNPSDDWAKAAFLALVRQKVLIEPEGTVVWDAPISRQAFIALIERGLAIKPFDRVLKEPPVSRQPEVLQPVNLNSLPTQATSETPTKGEGIALLVERLPYLQPLLPGPILTAYFDDGIEVLEEQARAIAVAVLSGLVVNYPDVRQLEPQTPLTWANAIALVCQALSLPGVPPQYVTWYATLETIQPNWVIPFWQLRGNALLVKEIQTQLQKVKLYSPEWPTDGRFSLDTQMALLEFCRVLNLPNAQTYLLDKHLATTLQTVDEVDVALKAAQNRDRIFQDYWQQEKGYDASHLPFLDKGIEDSPFAELVESYPDYLRLKHPKAPQAELVNRPTNPIESPLAQTSTRKRPLFGSTLIGPKIRLFSSPAPAAAAEIKPTERHALCLTPQPYPERGVMPAIADNSLSFLHPDIKQACLCIGQFVDNQLRVNWLGRNPLINGEFWSATKIIPLLNLVSQVHSKTLQADIDNLVIRSGDRSQSFNVHDLAVDMVNYEYNISSSNAVAAMFRLFTSPQSLEQWLKTTTGNNRLTFRGNYGENAFIETPVLWDKKLKKVVLKASGARNGGSNAISAYDLTRLITMLGWHPHLPAGAQLPRAQWKSLESIVRAMGRDSARYVDAAIEQLSLQKVIQSPVIASKMGFGYSGDRNRTELVYSVFVQFTDTRPQVIDKKGFAPIRTFGLTLLAAKQIGNSDREATLLDARMATEVTEIIRRVLLNQWT